MSKVTYYYNRKTCQYEHAKLSLRDILVYCIGLITVGFVFFAGLIFLYNYLLETDTERALRAENKAIGRFQPVLEQKLVHVQTLLSSLDTQDKALYARLFNTVPPTPVLKHTTLSKESVLLANASAFRSLLENLQAKSSRLFDQAAYANTVFGNDIHITPDEVALLGAVPSVLPVSGTQPDNLSSGFGDRVNPFHKGTYHHLGIDFAFPRGTAVNATANGTVITVKRSDLQAGYGNYVEIDHGHGFTTRYAHLEEITVRLGQHVMKGISIATVGRSGGSIAPHLHYEVIRDGEQTDPILFMIEGLDSREYSLFLARSKKQNQSLD